MKTPGQKVLILAAICLSLVGSISAYKIATYQREQALLKKGGIIASSDTTSNNNTLQDQYLSALQQAKLAQVENSSSTPNPFAPSPNDTMTDSLSKNLFTSYLQYQNSGQIDDDQGQQALASQVLSNVSPAQMPAQKYSLNNISMFYAKNKDVIKAYGNQFAQIRATYLNTVAQNQAYYQNNLNALGTVFSNLGEELMKMKVPSEVAMQHLEIANDYIRAKDTFKIIADQQKDPLKSLLAIKMFKDDSEKQQEMYTELVTYFQTNGILFTNQEPGFFWMNASSTTSVQTSQ